MMNKQDGCGPHGHGRRNRHVMSQGFESIFKDFENIFNGTEMFPVRELYKNNFPPTNVRINKNSKDLIFEFAIAGYEEDGIELSFDGNEMFLELKKNKDQENDEYEFLHKGIKASSVKQSYFVPVTQYNTSEVKADTENGILKVYIPAREEVKPKKIKINLN